MRTCVFHFMVFPVEKVYIMQQNYLFCNTCIYTSLLVIISSLNFLIIWLLTHFSSVCPLFLSQSSGFLNYVLNHSELLRCIGLLFYSWTTIFFLSVSSVCSWMNYFLVLQSINVALSQSDMLFQQNLQPNQKHHHFHVPVLKQLSLRHDALV